MCRLSSQPFDARPAPGDPCVEARGFRDSQARVAFRLPVPIGSPGTVDASARRARSEASVKGLASLAMTRPAVNFPCAHES